MAKREYEKVLSEIRREEQRKFNANAEKEAVLRQLRKLDKMEAGELVDQKQKELDAFNRRKKALEEQEETLKHELERFMNKKQQLEAQSTTELGDLKMKASRARGQLEQTRDLEDDYAVGQGKKLAELQYKRQHLQQQKKNIEEGLQNLRQKRQQNGGLSSSGADSPNKFPPSAYTFKPQPFNRVEQYRKLALQSESSEYPEQHLNIINKTLAPDRAGTPNSQLINQRQHELEQLKRQYQSNGGDDPAFYNKIQALQNKYSMAGSRTHQEHKIAPSELPHRPYQPPRDLERSHASDNGSRQQPPNPFYNPNSPYEMYEKFAVRPNQKGTPQYIVPPNTFGNDQKLLLEQRIAADQSIEERVMSSVMAQQYDSLQILARLPKDSEIYQLKLRQYQQLSKIREDLMREAHEQRLLKVRRQFEMEKRLAEKDYDNDMFVDRMRMDIIKKKFGDSPLKSNRLQFSVMCESVNGLPLEAHACKVAFSVYCQGQQVTGVRQTQPKECERREQDQVCRLYERMECAVEPRQNMTAAFDVYVSHRDAPETFKLYAYSTVKLTNQEMRLGIANYELTLLEPPYRPLVSTQNETELPNNALYLKIFQGTNPPDSEFVNPRGISHKTQYAIFNAMASSSFLGAMGNPDQVISQRPQSEAGPLGLTRRQFQQPQGPKGYEFRLLAVRTEKPEQNVWLQLALYQEDQPLLSKKNSPLTFKSEYKGTVDIARRNNNLAEARLSDAWRIYDDLERLYRHNQRQLYLMIQLMQKQDNTAKVKGWHCLRLTNFQEMREGMVKVNLFEPEVELPPYDMNRAKGKLRDQVQFEICEFLPTQEEIEKHAKPQLLKSQNFHKQSGRSKRDRTGDYEPSATKKTNGKKPHESIKKATQSSLQSSKPSIRSVMAKNQPSEQINPQESVTSILQLPPQPKQRPKKGEDLSFISNNEMQYKQEPAPPSKTFDLHISQIKNIPGGVGICKLYINLLDSKNRKLLPAEEFLPPFEENGSALCQSVGYTRHIKNVKMSSDAIALIQLASYNEHNGEVGLLGACVFPLFVEKDSQHYLTSGHYQVPVFWTSINEYMDIDYAFTLPKIPGLSLLISVAPQIQQESIPDYESGEFSTVFYEIEVLEQKVTKALYKRARHTQRQSVQTLYKAISRKYVTKEVHGHLNKLLKNGGKLLNLNALLPEYDREMGFSLNIDGLCNTEGTNFYLITVCLSPPASYYTGERMDLVFLTSTNLDSHKCFPLYDNNTFSYNEDFNQNSCFVIEVVEIQLMDPATLDINLNSFGYAMLPVFEKDREFVRAGHFELQLYEGDFPEEKIDKLKDYYKYLADFQSNDKIMKGTTMQVKLVNNYFQAQFPPCMNPNEFRLPMPQEGGTVKPKEAPPIAEDDKITQLLPKNVSKEKFFESLDECIYKLYDGEQ